MSRASDESCGGVLRRLQLLQQSPWDHCGECTDYCKCCAWADNHCTMQSSRACTGGTLVWSDMCPQTSLKSAFPQGSLDRHSTKFLAAMAQRPIGWFSHFAQITMYLSHRHRPWYVWHTGCICMYTLCALHVGSADQSLPKVKIFCLAVSHSENSSIDGPTRDILFGDVAYGELRLLQ